MTELTLVDLNAARSSSAACRLLCARRPCPTFFLAAVVVVVVVVVAVVVAIVVVIVIIIVDSNIEVGVGIVVVVGVGRTGSEAVVGLEADLEKPADFERGGEELGTPEFAREDDGGCRLGNTV